MPKATEIERPFQIALKSALPEFLDHLRASIESSGQLSEYETILIRTYLGEVKVGLDLIAPYLKPGMRVLEIGSGIGALGHFLVKNGIDVTGIEPSLSGFDAMASLSSYVRAALKGEPVFPCKAKSCEDLSTEADGAFDLIFSVHVLEHVQDVNLALQSLHQVLKPSGTMVHLCPNYNFPYDPHFAIPIVLWSPRLTRRLYDKRISQNLGLWDSINFIRHRDLKAFAQTHAMSVTLSKGVMGQFIRRLNTDPVFKSRQSGFIANLANGIAKTPIVKLLDIWPAAWSSPMIICMKNKA